ncbi:MAG: superoxide dismutase [Bacteroidales bacterium]|nr:superoxide dismutase [Bacteroidales bacterium]
MSFELIQLPYAPDALEPVLSAETIGLHHGKHLQTYVNNLNRLLPDSGFEDLELEDIVETSTGAIFNNAGQILNHNLYFLQLKSPAENNLPVGKLAEAIDAQFGSFEAFKEQFTGNAAALFGSGWCWLACDTDGKLSIIKESNAGNPVTKKLKPLLTIDVWEHAYYVDYRNRRPEYIAAFWKIIDWNVIEERFLH